jgi:hypothetical protein
VSQDVGRLQLVDRDGVIASSGTPPFRQFALKVRSFRGLPCDHCYVYERADQSWRDRPRIIANASVVNADRWERPLYAGLLCAIDVRNDPVVANEPSRRGSAGGDLRRRHKDVRGG